MKFLDLMVQATKELHANPRVLDFVPVGSALYLDTAKDLDILVLASGTGFFPDDEEGSTSTRWAFGSDFVTCGGEYDDQTNEWGALRRGDLNLIVTVDRAWFEKMKLASEVCKALKLADKGDRIVVHRIVRDGYNADEANSRRDGSR